MSNDPEQEYFSDGITEDITSDLSKISSLFVIARNSAFTYKGKAVKVQDVSREIGVRYVLEGSVRKADNQVRITAQLIDATTGGICGLNAMTVHCKTSLLCKMRSTEDHARLESELTPEEQERFNALRPTTWRPMTISCAAWSLDRFHQRSQHPGPANV